MSAINPLRRIIAAFKHDLLDSGPEAGGSITHSFVNSSHVDIVVVDRNNEAILVEAAAHGVDTSNPGLEIKMTRTHKSRKSSTSAFTITNAIAANLGFIPPILKDTIDVINKSSISHSGCLSITRRFFVPIKDIENDGSVFEERTGLLLTVGGAYINHIHPDSVEFRTKNQNRSFLEHQPVGRLFEIVDNFRSHRERFVYVGNGVLKISYTVDPERADGLWVTEVESKGGDRSFSRTERYEFEEGFKKFGLYLTREEAETGGNPNLQLQREVEEARKTIILLERENQQEKVIQTREEQQQKVVLRDAEHQTKLTSMSWDSQMTALIDNQKAITAEMKQRAERDEIRRDTESRVYSDSLKTSSDFFKYVPIIATGVAAIMGGLMLFRKS